MSDAMVNPLGWGFVNGNCMDCFAISFYHSLSSRRCNYSTDRILTMKVSIVIACVCIFIGALLSYFTEINQSIFLFINSFLPIAPMWIAITTLGDGAVAGCIFYILLRKNNDALAKGLIAAVAGLLVIDGLKTFFGIPRPEHAADFSEPFHRLAADIAVTSFSMPSGHTAAAFLLGTLLFASLKLNLMGKMALGILMVAIGLSRIALGVHWPADVFAGAGLGMLIAAVCAALPIHIENRWGVLVVHLLYLAFVVSLVHKYFFQHQVV